MKIETEFTKLFNCTLPIIGAPMFLVSNEEMVIAISEAGGIGTIPSLNYRPAIEFKKTLSSIKKNTNKPIGVNLIVNKSNLRLNEDLKSTLDSGVELIITSLGSPKEIIKEAHSSGSKVFCDVINLDHALKVQELGADGVIAVCSGAGGHAGPLSPFSLIPWLKKELSIPVVAAGAIADGSSFLSALSLGACAVSMGTRFIASREAQVDSSYKDAIIKSVPTDIVMTSRISGTPASVINTPFIEKLGPELPVLLKTLKKFPSLKKYVQMLIYYLGAKELESSAKGVSWKQVWSAGQSVGAIDSVFSCKEIIESLVKEYEIMYSKIPKPHQE
jgi:nitronate monooxygenase